MRIDKNTFSSSIAAYQGSETVLTYSNKNPQLVELQWILSFGESYHISVSCHYPSEFSGMVLLNWMRGHHPSIFYIFDDYIYLCNSFWYVVMQMTYCSGSVRGSFSFHLEFLTIISIHSAVKMRVLLSSEYMHFNYVLGIREWPEDVSKDLFHI